MANKDAGESLKGLSPEEKIRRLKQLEQEKKKEIAEMKEEIKKSEDQIETRQKWVEKVPIPQVIQEDLEGLSKDGKIILKKIGHAQEESDSDKDEDSGSNDSLEETIQEEAQGLTPVTRGDVQYQIPTEVLHQQINTEYAAALSYKPVDETADALQGIYSSVEKRGYMTQEEQEFVRHSLSGLEKKAASGYNFTQQTAQQASDVRKIAGHLLHNAIKYSSSHDKGDRNPNDLYTGK